MNVQCVSLWFIFDIGPTPHNLNTLTSSSLSFISKGKTRFVRTSSSAYKGAKWCMRDFTDFHESSTSVLPLQGTPSRTLNFLRSVATTCLDINRGHRDRRAYWPESTTYALRRISYTLQCDVTYPSSLGAYVISMDIKLLQYNLLQKRSSFTE